MATLTTRDQIIITANQLFYQQGFEHTSFSDIAQIVNISRGNFYHHFKTKDDILDAVIDFRITKTQAMIATWEEHSESPEARIQHYIRIVATNWEHIKHYGCPVGTLCVELSKLDHGAKKEAKKIFTLFKQWLAQQFTLLGRESDAEELAMHVLAWSQGVATMANTFQNKKFVNHEVNNMCEWLSTCTTPPQ